jgi:hypothetical protein
MVGSFEMSDATSGQLSPDGLWRWDGVAWVAAGGGPSLPRWLPIGLLAPATWRVLALASVVALLADQAFRVGRPGFGAALALWAAAAALLIGGRIRSAQSRILLALACMFGAGLALRASPWLTIPDLVVALVLLATAASLSDRGSIFDLGFAEAGARILHGLLHLSLGVPFAARPMDVLRTRAAALVPLARGLLIALPVAILVASLLASADPVFASFFSVNLDPGQAAADMAYLLLGGVAMAGLLRLSAAEAVERLDGPRRRLGLLEGLVVIAVLDGLFAAFAIAQVVAASGNGAQALHRAGMTAADYARSGFFELLWVAGITLALLVLFSRVTERDRGRGSLVFRLFTQAAILLTLVIVYVAFRRLALYEAAYGFTMLRLYSHIFAVWIGLVFLLLSADLAGLGVRRRWLLGASGAAGLTILLTLNAINPEAQVVKLNTDRAASTGKLDVGYLGSLSGDSVPALVGASASLPANLRVRLSGAVCTGDHEYNASWAAFNLGDYLAAGVRREPCRSPH